MFEHVGRAVAVLGGAAGLTFCLAGGVAVGVVPQAGGGTAASVRTEAATTQEAIAPTTGDTLAPDTVVPDMSAPAPAPTTAIAKPQTTAPAPATVSSPEQEAAADTGGAADTAATQSGPTTAARVIPSSAQVKAAIAQIGAGLPITEAQARQFGDQVCSAFDQGQSFSAVKATALQEAKKVPFVTVSAGQVDAAVRAAVQLFCPGYSSKV